MRHETRPPDVFFFSFFWYKGPHPEGIGFTACIQKSTLKHIGNHHTIMFDRPITNIGHAYHPNTGVFIAPLNG